MIRVAQGQLWSKFENQDSDVCSFYRCISALESAHTKGVLCYLCPPWCVPANFRNTGSCKSQKMNYFAVLI